MSTTRGICQTKGCERQQTTKGMRKGVMYYRTLCGVHWRAKGLISKGLNKNECSLCGWEGPCDVHRIVWGKHGGAYTKGNISIVCPNCHRLIHQGQLFLCKPTKKLEIGKQSLLFEGIQCVS